MKKKTVIPIAFAVLGLVAAGGGVCAASSDEPTVTVTYHRR